MSIHISKGNMKLGKHIPNISLPPGVTCPKGIPCQSSSGCYATKAWRQWPIVRRAWGENLAEYVMDPKGYMGQVYTWLREHQTSYFRWHVAGDIPNQEYLDYMKGMARLTKSTRHLCFTKRYEYDYSLMPWNLSIIISAWPGYGIVNVPYTNETDYTARGFLPIAWCQDGTETRIPLDAHECPGSCNKCRHCWHTNHDVWFHKH